MVLSRLQSQAREEVISQKPFFLVLKPLCLHDYVDASVSMCTIVMRNYY